MTKRAPRATSISALSISAPAGGESREGRSRSALLVGTALGASILIFTLAQPGTARAADDCGPAVNAGSNYVAVCSPALNPYPNGISYTVGDGNALSVILEPGVLVNSDNFTNVYVHNTAGDAVLVAYDGAQVIGPHTGIYVAADGANLALIETAASVIGYNGVGAVANDPGGVAEVINAGTVHAYYAALYAHAANGYGRVQNSGALTTYNTYATFGYGIDVEARTGVVSNSGNISVHGSFIEATGIETEGLNGYIANSGVITVNNTEGVASGLIIEGQGGAAVVRNTGDLTVTGYAIAKGIYAYGATTSISSVGNLSVVSLDSAAIGAHAAGLDGYANLVLDGAIYVHGQNGYAYGAKVTGTGSGVLDLSGGSIYAKSDNDFATGAAVYVTGAAHVDTRNGSVRAYGVSATGIAATGDAVTIYSGAVDARASALNAVGIEAAAATGDVTVLGYGDVGAYGRYGAVAVDATAKEGAATVVIQGNVTAGGYNGGLGASVGVTASSASGYDTYVRVDGNVSVTGLRGATGVQALSGGNATVYVAGNVYAHDVYGAAGIGVAADAATGYNALVEVTGNVHMRGQSETSAIGVHTQGYDQTVVVGGYVNVIGDLSAIGVQESAVGGNAIVVVGGNVDVFAYSGLAEGVSVASDHAAHIYLGGVGATGGTAYGVSTQNVGQTVVSIGAGGVTATASGNATGVTSRSYADSASLTVTGPTTVTSYGGSAIGLENGSLYSSTLTSLGDVTVKGATYALGLKDSSGQNSYLTEVGNIKVTAYDGVAQGVISVGSIYANANLTGAITVTSKTGAAHGVTLSGYSGARGSLIGSVDVTAHYYALGVLAESGDGNVSLTGGGDVSATSLLTNATAVRAISPFTTAVALGNISATGLYGATGVFATGTTVDVGVQSVTGNAVFGNATGVNAYGHDATTVNVAGDVAVSSTHYDATGVRAYAYQGPVAVTIGGTTTATSHYGNAIGVTAVSAGYFAGTATVATGDVHVNGFSGAIGVTGNALGQYYCEGSCYAGPYSVHKTLHGAYLYGYTGGNTVTITTGNVSATTTHGAAIGVYAVGADSVVHVAGAINVTSGDGLAYGVQSFTTGTGNVTVDGDIRVGTLGYTEAAGVSAVGYRDQSITTHGNITVTAGEKAYGAYADSGGNASIHVDGNVYASAGLYTYGVMTRAHNTGSVYVGGDVMARGTTNYLEFSYATGVNVVSDYGDGIVHVGGNVTAYNPAGAATGVNVSVSGNATVYVGGAVDASAPYYKYAVGVFVRVNDNATVHAGSVQALGYDNAYGVQVYANTTNIDITGNVVAIADEDNAYGVEVHTNYGNVHVGGNVYARAFYGCATGGYLRSYGTHGTASFTVDGNVTAIGQYGAAAALVRAEYTGNIRVGGDVYAKTVYGVATGAGAVSPFATIYVGGNVTARSGYGNAYGVGTYAVINYITVNGDVTAVSSGANAIGVYGKVPLGGLAYVSVGGNVHASGYYSAKGVYVENQAGYTSIQVGGVVSAYAYGQATGIETTGAANITVGGVSAVSRYGGSYGVQATGTNYVALHVGNNIYARAYNGEAIGITANVTDGFYGNVGGNLVVIADEQAEDARIVTSARSDLTIDGNAVAISYQGGATGFYASGSTSWIAVHGGLTVEAYGAALGAELITGDIANFDVDGNARITSQTGTATGAILQSYADSVYVGGSLTVLGYNNALGVSEHGSYVQGVDIGGNLTVQSSTGNATGITIYSEFSQGDVFVGGNVLVSAYGDATGIAVAAGRDFDITVDGNLTVNSATGAAAGVTATAYNVYFDSRVMIMGATTVNGATGAVGVSANVSGGVLVQTGAVTAISSGGGAYGIDLISESYVASISFGDVYAKGADAAAGVFADSSAGSAQVYVGGNVTAISSGSQAVGVYAGAAYGAAVTIAGSVFAHGAGNVTGVYSRGGDGGAVYVDGGVTAIADSAAATGVRAYTGTGTASVTVDGNLATFASGNATGVFAESNGGNVSVDVGGNVYSISYGGNAVGIHADAPQGEHITVGNAVRTYALYNATGIDVSGAGYANVTVGSVVAATATDGEAIGVYAHNTGYVSLNLGGASAHGATDAFGVYVNTPSDVSLITTGDINAVSTGANAIGASIRTSSQVDVSIGGNVIAVAPGTAEGLYVASSADVHATVGGVYARSSSSNAYGVDIQTAGNINASVTGNAEAIGYGHAIAVLGYSTGGNVTVSAGGVVNAISTGADGYGSGVVAIATGYASAKGGTSTYATGVARAIGVSASGFTGAYAGAIGNVRAVSYHLAIGVDVRSGPGDVTVNVGGVSTAISHYEAMGIKAYSSLGNVSVTAGGAVAATDMDNKYALAIGLYAHSNNQAVTGNISGDVYARGAGDVFGADVAGWNTANLTVGGNATALGEYYGATAVWVNTNFGPVGAYVGGNVYAASKYGAVTGVNASTGYYSGDAVVSIGGDTTVQAVYGSAFGVIASGFSTGVTTGNVTAISQQDKAIGIEAFGYQSAGVTTHGDVDARGYALTEGVVINDEVTGSNTATAYLHGNVLAQSARGDAYGVVITGGGFDSLYSYGNIVAVGYGNATGLKQTHSNAAIYGNVGAYAHNGTAYGVNFTSGQALIYVAGNVVAVSDNGNATGVKAASAGFTGQVQVYGNVVAQGAVNATGVNLNADVSANVYVGGSVTALAGTGSAVGVEVHENYESYSSSDINVRVGGTVTADSTYGAATGIAVQDYYSSFGGTIDITAGNVVARGALDAYGVTSTTHQYTDIHVYGNVTAVSTGATAYGVKEMVTDARGAVVIGGDATAASAVNAYGVYQHTNEGGSVDITGNATARSYGGNATAVKVNDFGGYVGVGGSVFASATGAAYGVKLNSGLYGTINITGNATAKSSDGSATAVYARGFSELDISVGGDVTAIAYGEATGVEAYTKYASANANVTGNVTAYSTGANARGVVVDSQSAYGNVSVGGDIFAEAPGSAYGVIDTSNMANVSVGGNVIVISTDGAVATGVSVDTVNGLSVNVGGYVFAETSGQARGIATYAGYGVTGITVSGNVTAKSTNDNAIGVYAVGGGTGGNLPVGGDITVNIGGTTRATSYAGAAYGVYVRTGGNASVTTADVAAYSHDGNATGVWLHGDSTITVNGNATAMSYAGNARAVYGNSSGYLGVNVTGAVYASSNLGNATGVVAVSTGDSNVLLGGDVRAATTVGDATGLYVASGNSTVAIGGNVTARSVDGVAYGVFDRSVTNVNVTVTGEVVALSTDSAATGLYASGATVHASIGGAYVYSVDAEAIGENVIGSFVYANTTGDVFSKSIDAAAYGISARGTSSNAVYAHGNVTAVSIDSVAIGVDAPSQGASTAYVSVSGEVTAQSTDGDAIGVFAYGFDSATVKVGSASAYSVDSGAVGLEAYSRTRGEVDSVGDVRARSYSNDAEAVRITSGILISPDIGSYVDIGGNAIASSHNGEATAVAAYDSSIANITVGGAAIAYSDERSAVGVGVAATEYAYIHVGSAYASGNTAATGLHVTSGGNLTVIADGDVVAKASNGEAIGVYANAAGSTAVDVGGNVVARSAAAANAYGVLIDTGSANVTVGGEVEAITATGSAYGVLVNGAGNVSVSVGGGYVYSQNLARGIEVNSAGDIYGAVSTGTLFVKSVNDAAVAIDLETSAGNVTLGGVGGNVVAVSVDGAAYGVAILSKSGSTGGSVGGYVTAIGYTGAIALGAFAPDGSAGIGAGGDVSARTTQGDAYGAQVLAGDLAGDVASVSIGGTVEAFSTYGNAVGVRVNGGYGNVSVGGGVEVLGGITGYGVYSTTADGAHISIAGNTIVLAPDQAVGVHAIADAGPVYVGTGNVLAVSSTSWAAGIDATSDGGDISTHTTGSITAAGQYAVGVFAYTSGNTSIEVTGGVSAYGAGVPEDGFYAAVGVFAKNADNTSITVGGTVTARATGRVYGVEVYSAQSGNVSVSLGGVLATAGTGYAATGVNVSTAGNISVGVSGNTVVMGGEGAYGVRALSYGGGNVAVSLGNVTVGETGAGSTDKARGVYAETTGNISVDISGNTLVGGELAWGVYSYSTGGGNISIDVGNVTVHQYAGYAGDNSAGILAYTQGNVDLTVGDITVTGNYIAAIRLSGLRFTPTGNITLNVGNVTTMGDHSPGFYLVTEGPNTNITLGNVYTAGNYSDGVYVKALDGNASVTVGNVTTKGNDSDGVYVWAYDDAATTATGTVYTKGAHSDGLWAYSETGGVTVTANVVVTKGDYSQGVHAVAGGAVVVNNITNITYGAHSDAVYAKNSATTLTDTVTVTSGNAITHGDFSDGIYAEGYHSNSVASTLVKTYGNHSTGIYAGSVNGPVSVTSGAVVTYGKYALAIDVVSGGTASVTANTTIAHGDDSGGISVFAPGSIYVGSHYVRTYGFGGEGISALSTHGPVDVVSYDVHTSGDFATGIVAGAVYGNVSVTSTQVITDGAFATGINAGTLVGDTSVSSGYVRTNGNNSDGIFVNVATGNATATSGGAVTYGAYSDAIGVSAYVGNVSVTSTYAATHGYKAGAVIAYADHGDVAIVSDTVKTFGDYATGVSGASNTGDVSVSATYIATHGYYADGVDGDSTTGNVAVHVGTVKTFGDNAYGAFGYSTSGNVYVGATAAVTHGNLSTAVAAYAKYGNASIGSVYARTYGDHAVGLYAEGGAGASVIANTVITSGNYSIGVLATSHAGNASASSNYVHTSGNYSDGVDVYGNRSATATNAGYVGTTGASSVGILAASGAGSVSVTSQTVVTSGNYAGGIEAYGLTDTSVSNSNVVKTTGYDAMGIHATAYSGNAVVTSNIVATYGDDSKGVFAFSTNGGARVTSTTVYTAGAHSGGIDAESKFGNVSVTSGHVVTKGDYSTGIYTYAVYAGITTIDSTDVRTYGNHSVGIEGVGYSGLTVNSGQVITRGNFATAIFAVNYIGDTDVTTTGVTAAYGFGSDAIYAQNFVSGNVSVSVAESTYAKHGVGVRIDAEGGGAFLSNHSRIYGAAGGVVAYSVTGTTVENYGEVLGSSGYAMGVSGGAALVNNHGSIYGYAKFTANNDTVNNTGRWFAYGNTDFGAGTDTFNNTNVVFVAPFAVAPETVNWTGLEVFNNSGLVDLRNGHTGDIFNLTSDTGFTAWNGAGNSTLGVDVALSANLTSDKLVIGAASGTTALVINDVSPGVSGAINMTGTTVVQATSGQASNFTWGGFKKGFIDYELKFFTTGSNVDWNIVSLPDNAAFEMLKAPAMAQDFWRRSGDTWSDREQEVRDSMWGSTPPTRGEGWEMWANAVGGGERLTRHETLSTSGGPFATDLSTNSTWGGFQMGGDNWTSKNWLWGFTAGFVDQNSALRHDGNSFDIVGWNVGAYGGFTSGSFFLNGLAKGDFYDVRANMHTVPALETFHGDTWGAKGEAGWRLGGPSLYFEPRADIAWTTTHLNNAEFPGQQTVFTFGDATSVRGSIGARVGGQWGSTLPYVGIYAVQEFDGKNRMSMISGSGCPACMSVEDLRPGAYEKAEFGFTTTSWNGLEGFAKGDAEFGGHTAGFTGTMGVRWRW